jgi:hypothetical protein
MSGLPERDLSLWLHNKLEEPWSCSKISSFITSEIMKSISEKFDTLDPLIKIRVLFSFIILRKYVLKELENDINHIIKLGLNDDDEWVRIISSLLSTFTSKGTVAYSEIQKNESFHKMFDDVVKKQQQLTEPKSFFPLDYPYLSTSLFPKELLQTLNRNPHFTVQKKTTPRLQLLSSKKSHLSPTSSSSQRVPLTHWSERASLRVSTESDSRGATSSSSVGVSTPSPTKESQDKIISKLFKSDKKRLLSSSSRESLTSSSTIITTATTTAMMTTTATTTKVPNTTPSLVTPILKSPMSISSQESLSSPRSYGTSEYDRKISGFQKKKQMQVIDLQEELELKQHSEDKILRSTVSDRDENEKKKDDLKKRKRLTDDPNKPKRRIRRRSAKLVPFDGEEAEEGELRKEESHEMSHSLPDNKTRELQSSTYPSSLTLTSTSTPTPTSIPPPTPTSAHVPKPVPKTFLPMSLLSSSPSSTSTSVFVTAPTPVPTLTSFLTSPSLNFVQQFLGINSSKSPAVKTPTQTPTSTPTSSVSQTSTTSSSSQNSQAINNVLLALQQLPPHVLQGVLLYLRTQQSSNAPLDLNQLQRLLSTLQLQQQSPQSQVSPSRQTQGVPSSQTMLSSTPSSIQHTTPTSTPVSAPIVFQITPDPEVLLGVTNRLSPEDKAIIVQFLSGNRVNPHPEKGPVRQFLLNETIADGIQEQIVFEINYSTSVWRKLKRRRPLHNVSQSQQQQQQQQQAAHSQSQQQPQPQPQPQPQEPQQSQSKEQQPQLQHDLSSSVKSVVSPLNDNLSNKG